MGKLLISLFSLVAFSMSSTTFSADFRSYVFVNNDSLRKATERCSVKGYVDDAVVVTIDLTKTHYECLSSQDEDKNDLSFGESPIISSLNESITYKRSNEALINPNQEVFYLAKEDFGLVNYLKKNPTHDGRGVIAGVIDDGVSPIQSGFKLTSSGERKYLKHFSNSSFYQVKVQPSLLNGEESLSRYGLFDEELNGVDLNGDSKNSTIKFKVVSPRSPEDTESICADLNENDQFETHECVASFNKTGEYLIKQNKLDALLLEYNQETSTVSFNEGEGRGDSHGEGVASVLLGHKIGSKFDGVAPGAQLIDYDLSERGANADESAYTIGKFLTALELLAKNGASIINISYSLYFSSIESQLLMKSAIEKISNKYECLIVFSAGNNGPGLGSLNRSAIYPHNSFRTGAFVGKKLDEYVHGVTGLPDEGRVIYYSSRGPGAMGGAGPSLIAPLASLAHADIRNGFRGFSGTSSASPALAGFATVFKSAIIESGRVFNFDTFVYSIKYSGKRLKNSPFIEQGYGLPKIEKALEIYDLMIRGNFPRVTTIAVDQFLRWGLPSDGLVLKRSELDQHNQFFAYLTHQFPSSVSKEDSMNIVLPVSVESSNFIETVQRSWLDQGTNRFGFSIDKSKINWGHNTEIFGEISVRDEMTNSIVAVIPVTLIDDTPLNSTKIIPVSIGAEEGKRIHLNLGKNVKGLGLVANLLNEDDDRIIVTLYNPYGIRVQRKWLDSFSLNSFKFGIEEPGHYQIGLSRSKGTNTNTKFNLSVSPISLGLVSNITKLADEKINVTLKNFGKPLSGQVLLTVTNEINFKGFVSYEKSKGFEFTWPDINPGEYELLIESEHDKFSYFSIRCFHRYGEGKEISGFELNVPAEVKTVTTRCIPFDYFYERESGDNLIFSWRKKGSKNFLSSSRKLQAGSLTRFTIPVEGLGEGISNELQVRFLPKNSLEKDALNVGDLELLR